MVGVALKYLRAELKLTMRAMAKEMEISHIHLCNIENNKADPSPKLLEKFEELYGVDLYIYSWAMQITRGPYAGVALEIRKIWRHEIEHRKVR